MFTRQMKKKKIWIEKLRCRLSTVNLFDFFRRALTQEKYYSWHNVWMYTWHATCSYFSVLSWFDCGFVNLTWKITPPKHSLAALWCRSYCEELSHSWWVVFSKSHANIEIKRLGAWILTFLKLPNFMQISCILFPLFNKVPYLPVFIQTKPFWITPR